MPTLVISLVTGSVLAQVLMRSFEEVMRQPYIVPARAKGLSRGAYSSTRSAQRRATAMTILGVIAGHRHLLGGGGDRVQQARRRSLTQQAFSNRTSRSCGHRHARRDPLRRDQSDRGPALPGLDPRISHYAKAA